MANAATSIVALVSRSARSERAAAHAIGRLAVRSLHAELVLYPKPGLVSLRDSGAHRDMDASTFMRSLFALRHYFVAIALAGMKAAPMTELRRLGLAAERAMLRATGGINTHRGAIFALGLLSAAAGYAWASRMSSSDTDLRGIIAALWRRELLAVAMPVASSLSHGMQSAARYGARGARGEAIEGFPSVFEIALPALREALGRDAGDERAQLHALFLLLVHVTDTNVLYRGGAEALARLHASASDFVARGSVFATGWLTRAEALHRECSLARISPGGCADLFAAAWFVHQLQHPMQ